MPSEKETGQSGRNVDMSQAEQYTGLEQSVAKPEFPTSIERSDIQPHAIEAGETELVLQRHGKYARNAEQGEIGSLTNFKGEKNAAAEYFEKFIEQLPEDERGSSMS